jgi:hypothetical protein
LLLDLRLITTLIRLETRLIVKKIKKLAILC